MNNNSTRIQSLDDVRSYFSNAPIAYYFVSATSFNLMNMHEWVSRWTHVNLIDCFDHKHPAILLPSSEINPHDFLSLESINRYQLEHLEVIKHIEHNRSTADAADPQVIFLFFDAELEAQCANLGLSIALPDNALVQHIDSKIITTEIGNEAGVPSVPNVLAPVDSWTTLCALAKAHKLGTEWVIQAPYGDSGKTTWFIANEDEFNAVSHAFIAEKKVKVMQRIQCQGTAIEGCATRAGTFVGPLLSELIGIPTLTPYPGGWCGNALFQDAFSDDIRSQAHAYTERLGNALYQRGYRGYFEVDYLIDKDTGSVYLGELNARITGITAMTNQSDFCAKTVPLFLFHLLEYAPVTLELDPTEYNRLSLQQGASGQAGQLVFKYLGKGMQLLEDAPKSGCYCLHNGQLQWQREALNRREVLAENEAFFLRILKPGDISYKDADMGIIFVNQRLHTSDGVLTPVAERWISAIHQAFQWRDMSDEEQQMIARFGQPINVLKGFQNPPDSTELKDNSDRQPA